jgi:hypothetical protein
MRAARALLALSLAVVPPLAAMAQDGMSIATYLWLDTSGDPAAYRSIASDAGTLYLDLFAGSDETTSDRPATEADIAAMTAALKAQLTSVTLDATDPPQAPYITIEWGFSDVSGSVNVVQSYAPDALPPAIAALQTAYFGSVIGPE